SKGSVVSFLTSTPQTGVDSIIATYGMMGPIFAIFRPIAAFLMGIIGGLVTKISETDYKKEINSPKNIQFQQYAPKKELSLSAKLRKIWDYAFVEFLDDIVMHFIVGLVIAGLISYFLPADFLMNTGLNSGILGMLVMIAIGV